MFVLSLKITTTWSKNSSVWQGAICQYMSLLKGPHQIQHQVTANRDHSRVVWRGLTVAWSPPRPEREIAGGVNGKNNFALFPIRMSKTKGSLPYLISSSNSFFTMKTLTRISPLGHFSYLFLKINAFRSLCLLHNNCLVLVFCVVTARTTLAS